MTSTVNSRFTKDTTDLDKLKNGEKFTWGNVIAFHNVGPYDIVEYDKIMHGENTGRAFHIYIDGKSQSRGYDSLDAALVGCVAINNDGLNTKADRYFMKMVISTPE